MIRIWGWILLIGIIGLVLSHDGQSDTRNFTIHYNPSNQVITGFVDSKTLLTSTPDEYLQVNVEKDLLTLKMDATEKFPEFSRSTYDMTIPLPLPKNFDLSAFIDDGKGVVAVVDDLVNNTVEFSVTDNQFVRVESVQVSSKVSRAGLRLKEQVLRLPEPIELEIVATDRSVPAKRASVKMMIKPDLTIEYNNPPAFKRNFVQEDLDSEAGNTVVVELIPGTAHEAVEYSLLGDDATYFELSAADDKSRATVVLNQESKPSKGKHFLSVVVEAKRSNLQKAECVILIDLKESTAPDGTAVETTLKVLHLEEEQVHKQVFPSRVGDCSYEIVHQVPNRTTSIFQVDETTNWIVAFEFDREDADLFKDVDPLQFQLVLRLNCPASIGSSVKPPVFVNEMPYSVDTTYLIVIVDDINDNAPIFTFPKPNDVFAFPVARISERLLPSTLLQVTANDLDAGLNAIIQFSITQNDHFGIDPKTGVIFPLKNALDGEEAIHLEIMATDRGGAEDGNVSKLSIQVVPAVTYQLSVLQVEGVTADQLDEYIDELQRQSGFIIRIVTGGYTSLVDAGKRETGSNTVQRLIVAAFDKQNQLVSSENLEQSLEPLEDITVFNLEILGCSNEPVDADNIDCTVYPYIVVMSVFIVLFVAASALSAYFWFKWRLLIGSGHLSNPNNVLVDNPYMNAGSTPPVKRKDIDGATEENSSESVYRSSRLPRNHSGMLIIDENEGEEPTAVHATQLSVESSHGTQQRKKSIRFSENVERIA